MENFILSCDWGTTSFRLKLVDTRSHQIIAEVFSNSGILSTYDAWKLSCVQEKTRREDFYLRQLRKHISILSQKTAVSLSGIPIIISGMACSTIGIMELPYAAVPFSIDGSSAIRELLPASYDFPFNVLLVSGVKSKNDVMRGEETQIIGLAGIENITTDEITICIFPGTHSKYIKVQNKEIIEFHTYMTGELFNILAKNSILKDSILMSENKQSLKDIEANAFVLGINESNGSNLLNILFSVRVNELFGRLSREENFFYLSGLLIGSELRDLLGQSKLRILLCSGSKVDALYQLAISTMDLLDKTTIISSNVVDNAAVNGHIKLFEKYNG